MRWTKTNTTLLETGDNSWCHFRPMEIERKEGDEGGVGGLPSLGEPGEQGRGERSTDGEEKTKSTHSTIRLKRDNMLYL